MAEINQTNVERALGDCSWVQHILTYDNVNSTMDVAREAATSGAPEATVVIAACQSRGRGRLARSWLSPEGSLSLSILLYPSEDKLQSLTMMAGLAAARAISDAALIQVDLKWPNDLLIRGRKVGGILVESGYVGGRQFAVIGIGINVNLDAMKFAEIADIATSLSVESGAEVDVLKLLRGIIVETEALYVNFNSQGIYDEWRQRLVTLGCRVTAVTDKAIIEGLAEDVKMDGSLIIRSDDGRSHNIIAGDVMLRHVS
jgi:BirA family biotin operon repressor/biotin-[acetyl-CoA-carboxylase] ligase